MRSGSVRRAIATVAAARGSYAPPEAFLSRVATRIAQLPPAPAASGPAPDWEASTLPGEPEAAGRSAASDAAIFTVGTYAAQAILFVAGVAQKAILGPVGYGYWALMQTFWTFFSMASLGAQHGATRQIPAHRGRGDFAAAEAVAGTAGSFSLVAVSLLGSGVAAFAILFGAGWAPEMRFGLVLLGATAPLQYLTDVHEVVIQAVKRFDSASLTVVVKAGTALLLQTFAVYLLGFYGMFLGLVAVNLSAFFLWARLGLVNRRRPAFRLGIDWERLRELIRFGAPIMIYAQVWLLFVAVDSLIVAGALDVERLGYYALAVSASGYILYLPRSIGAVLFPRMTERFAQTGEIAAIRHYLTDVQRVLAYLLIPLAVAAGFFGFPVVIRHVLPDFEPAVPVVQIMMAASFFMALVSMPVKVLITAGYRWSLTLLMLVCLGVNAGLNYTAVVVLDGGIEAAAGATAVSYLVTFLLTTWYCLSKTLAPRKVLGHIAELLLVFAHAYAALRLVEWGVGSPETAVVPDGALACLKIAGFLLLMSPWLVLAQRRLEGVSMLLRAVSGGGRMLRRFVGREA